MDRWQASGCFCLGLKFIAAVGCQYQVASGYEQHTGRFVKLGIFAGKSTEIISVFLDGYHQGIQFQINQPLPDVIDACASRRIQGRSSFKDPYGRGVNLCSMPGLTAMLRCHGLTALIPFYYDWILFSSHAIFNQLFLMLPFIICPGRSGIPAAYGGQNEN